MITAIQARNNVEASINQAVEEICTRIEELSKAGFDQLSTSDFGFGNLTKGEVDEGLPTVQKRIIKLLSDDLLFVCSISGNEYTKFKLNIYW